MNYTVLIVGAGKIGAFFDSPESDVVVTHAHGFFKAGFELVGFVDVDAQAAQRAANLWGGVAYQTIDEAFAAYDYIDVVCVAAPDDYHYEILKQIANHRVGVVFAEKPLTKTLEQAAAIIALYEHRSIPLLVNYSRRFVPELQKLRQEIVSGLFGKYITGMGVYGKGVLHNGSHLFDLLSYLIDKVVSVQASAQIVDFMVDDPSVSGLLWFNDQRFFVVQVVPCSAFTIFECDLLFEKARIRIIESGARIEYYAVHASTVFTGYQNLVFEKQVETSLLRSMVYAVQHVRDCLSGKVSLICTGHDAYQAMQIALSLKAQLSLLQQNNKNYEKNTTLCL